MQVQPYLNFDGRCQEAINFYKTAVGAEVLMLMHFKDSPEPCGSGTTPPGDKVMHAALQIGESTVFASDCNAQGKTQFQGISLSLTAKDDAATERLFNNLSAHGGKVCVPLNKTFFSSRFGVVTDQFGVTWMVLTQPAQPR